MGLDWAVAHPKPLLILTDERPLISLEPRPRFDGLGGWTLAPRLKWPAAAMVPSGNPRENRKLIRRQAPHAPGVYGMVDRQGELIYIGQSKSLRMTPITWYGFWSNRMLCPRTSRRPPKTRCQRP